MTPKHHHNPSEPASTRARCPVCHEAVYSRAGIHPQCAVRQSEPARPKAPPKPSPAVEGEAANQPLPTDPVAGVSANDV